MSTTELHILRVEDEAIESVFVVETWDIADGCLFWIADGKRTALPLHRIDHFWMPVPPREPDPWEEEK